MSELRQRRAEPGELDKKGAAQHKTGDDDQIALLRAAHSRANSARSTDRSALVNKRKLAETIADILAKSIPQPTKGMSDEAKQLRDQLTDDPFNMDVIFRLGLCYAQDEHWDKCCNVLMRGWKRVSELVDTEYRFHFLLCLAEGSQKSHKFRQALAVLETIEEPEDPELATHYEALRCQIFCQNGDMQRGLNALSKAVDAKPFDEALKIWVSCLVALRKAGALDLSRGTILALTNTEEEKAKVDTVAKMVILREEFYRREQPVVWDVMKKTSFVAFAAILVGILLYLLYLAESASLSRFQWRS